MAHYDISHGGLPQTWGNPGYAMLPSKEVRPYDFMEPAAHHRPSTFMVNRYLWFGPEDYYAELNVEAKRSPALTHFLRNLRADGRDIEVDDTFAIITLPIDNLLRCVYFRNLRSVPGFVVQLEVWNKDGDILQTFDPVDLGVPHLDKTATVPPTYTEGFIPPWSMPSNEAVTAQAEVDAAQEALDSANPEDENYGELELALEEAQARLAEAGGCCCGYYLGHNHELVMRIVSVPTDGDPGDDDPLPTIDDVMVMVAAELVSPWLGAW